MNLEDVDFRNLDALGMIETLKSLGKPGLDPLIRLIAMGHAYENSNHVTRIAIADGEREVERLIRQFEMARNCNTCGALLPKPMKHPGRCTKHASEQR